jgi:hypothetical protein
MGKGCLWTIIGFVIGAIGLWLCREAWYTDKLAVLYLGPIVVLCIMFCWARVMDAIGAAEAKVYAVTGHEE